MVVLDVPLNKTCTPQLVKDVIKNVYRRNGLCPDVSIYAYGEAHMRQFMEDEERLSVKAKEYRSALQVDADKGDNEAQAILSDLNK